MGFPPTSQIPNNNSHLYPQALQLKLYQAFIFSIPILFSIILFLLFYLFYLKRRANSFSSNSQILPTSANNNQPTIQQFPNYVCQIGLKKEIKDKLPIVLFDEELGTRESQCCVCLGEFEVKEELLQMPSCKHLFHIECIHHWLHTNTTCPLCRSFVIPISKFENQDQDSSNIRTDQTLFPVGESQNQIQHILVPVRESQSDHQPQILPSEQHQGSSNSQTEQTASPVEESENRTEQTLVPVRESQSDHQPQILPSEQYQDSSNSRTEQTPIPVGELQARMAQAGIPVGESRTNEACLTQQSVEFHVQIQ
ncbi:RING/U-box superfamily protein [Euphorbia peplus]|nr:RING/U-box superfamily protein [Euphorbia peplus]